MPSQREELAQLAKDLRLSHVLAKAAENYSWEGAQAEYAREWYVKHWYLARKYPERPLAAVSKAADRLWHQHIIDTRKYAEDCDRILGRFMNHTPIYGTPSEIENNAYQETLQLYEEEFSIWPSDHGQTSGDYSYCDPAA